MLVDQLKILLIIINSIFANDFSDFRYLSYNESFESIQIYENGDQAFDALIIDQDKNQIIVGAKNAIIRLSIEQFHLLERFSWESTVNQINLCRNHIRSLNECENYIRVLALRPTDQWLLTCGTNSYQPICLWRRSDSLSTILSDEQILSGDGKSPYNSQYPFVYNLIENGDLYSASRNEPIFGVNDPLIQRSFSQEKQLRTQQHDSNWLKNPYFVRILNIGSYIYTFFREISLEHLSCGMNIYSRVARICKYDQGTMKFSDTFRTFSKLRLLCSKTLTNDISSFDYNQLQAIDFDSSSNFIYGAFNLPKSAPMGSAICMYTVEQLENVFQSPFLYQKSNESFWLPSPIEQDTEKCQSNPSDINYPIRSGPVLRSGILQSSIDPLIFDDIRIGHLLIDRIHDLTILFIITLDGLSLRKYSLLKNEKLCLIEQISLKPPNVLEEYWKVNRVEFISQTKEILLTTHQSVMKIPVARCQRFSTSHLCSSSMDPYCHWNHHYQQCMFSIDSSIRYFTCPNVNTTIDGGWSTWSSWFACDQCQCRTRTCTQPKPQFHGKSCQGNSIEIERCQIDGGWSSWSSWSECPKDCGENVRFRTRTCTNPQPKNNGRLCIGNEQEEDLCPQIFCTNRTTQWTICSKSCGQGIQKRFYSDQCLEEIRFCNEEPCPTMFERTNKSMKIIWSNWTRIKIDDEEISDIRTEFICTISNQELLEMNSKRIHYRICDLNGKNCQERDQLDQWTPWSNWTDCYPSCDIIGSIETRHRICLNKPCIGKNLDKRNCTSCSSILKSNWSCWSDWSECSSCTLTKSLSIQIRTRTCLTNSCQGLSYEERSCLCSTLIHQLRFSFFHLIFMSLISFSFGCLLILCIYTFLCYSKRKFDEHDFQQSTTLPPQTFVDSSIYLTNGKIPSKKFNMYINRTEIRSIPSPPPATTLKRTSIMSSMKTNLDAEDL